MIPLQFALRRRMMMAGGGGGVPISDLPLGALINVGTDGGAGAANYEIADINNLVSGGVVLVRKNVYSNSEIGSVYYSDSSLDNMIKSTIYGRMPQTLRDKMMDVTFALYHDKAQAITRKMFALTYTMLGFGDNYGVTEGKALQLYTSNASRKKTFNGSAAPWWTASFRTRVNYISEAGQVDEYYGVYSEIGVVFAFVIPSKTPHDSTPNTDGSYNLIL